MFSGGATSSYMSWLVAQEHGKQDVILLHTPTYSEHEDADRFREQVSDYIGLPMTPQADGRDIWQLIDDNKCLPSDRFPFCTRILKLEQRIKFCEKLKEDYILYYGLDVDEYLRAQNLYVKSLVYGVTVKFPLIEKLIKGRDAKKIITDEWHICLPEPYKHLKHNNCIPCFKAGIKEWRKYWLYYPDRFYKAVDKERQIGHTVFKGISLLELVEVWERNQEQGLDIPETSIPCMCSF
jgi:hypothetical protein